MSDITLCDCEELWIIIKDNKNKDYALSSKGRLYSYEKKKFIVSLNNFFSIYIHRLVYRYFNQINIEKVNENNRVLHINNIKNHNCVCNLCLLMNYWLLQ